MIMSRNLSVASVLLFAAILSNSCKHEPWVPDNFNPSPDDSTTTSASCSPDTAYFVNEVLPIFASSCALSGCHDAITAEDGVILTDYFHILSTGDIEAADPNHSEVYEVLLETGEDMMPPTSSGITLTADQKNAIYTWILQGAQNNACVESSCDSTNVSYAADVRPIFELHCLGCHTGSALAGGGIPFDTHTQVSAYVNNGRLVGAINHQPGFSAMPQGQAKLDDCKIAIITNWISEGTQDN